MKQLVYILCLFVLLGCAKKHEKPLEDIVVRLISIPNVSEVGDVIELQFALKGNGIPTLLLESSLGPKLFLPHVSAGKATFLITEEHTRQSGLYHWQVIGNNKKIATGNFQLQPKRIPQQIESYFGPRSIRAGGADYSMLVVMPTDVYDNLLADSTQVTIVRQIDSKTITDASVLKDGFTWRILYSEEKAGRMLVAASVNGTASKELTSIIAPSNATNFDIEYQRIHEFADGNQVISFITSLITDRFGNVVSDGTLVNFIITNKKGIRLQTSSTTLSGVATGRLLHPDETDEWEVNAFVTGEAKSKPLSVVFKPAVTDFEVTFSNNNRQINIGPVAGFMKQLVPDGLLIQLMVYGDSGRLLETKTTNSRLGKGRFILDEGFFPTGIYVLKLQLAGLEKEFKRMLVANEVE